MLIGLTDDLAQSIQRMEGACNSGGDCRNNNPGNLRAGPGMIGTDSRGIAIFPDFSTGWAALQRQVTLNIGRGLTLSEFFSGKPGVYAGYAPSADSNNPASYASQVAAWLGLSPDTVLSSVGDSSTSAEADAAGVVDTGDSAGGFPYLTGALALGGLFLFSRFLFSE